MNDNMIIDDNGVVWSGDEDEMNEIMWLIEQGDYDDERIKNVDWDGDLVHVKEISRTR